MTLDKDPEDRGESRASRESRESDNETGDELGDYKEPQEEELSLLGHSLDTNTPVPIIRAPITRHKHCSAGQAINSILLQRGMLCFCLIDEWIDKRTHM